VFEMEDINGEFGQTDVVLVLGAKGRGRADGDDARVMLGVVVGGFWTFARAPAAILLRRAGRAGRCRGY
jgi:NAD/NADP transhydrogenase beta subunit